jgi:hypothetical protein
MKGLFPRGWELVSSSCKDLDPLTNPVVAIGSSALPWLRWRLSLRTLLIATTLVAAMLGVIVYFIQ